MTKELFIETLSALQKQEEHDDKCKDAFDVILDCRVNYNNNLIKAQLIRLLEEAMNDEDEWIKYFVWDLRFGERYKEGCIRYGGKPIKLSNAGELYDFLK